MSHTVTEMSAFWGTQYDGRGTGLLQYTQKLGDERVLPIVGALVSDTRMTKDRGATSKSPQ